MAQQRELDFETYLKLWLEANVDRASSEFISLSFELEEVNRDGDLSWFGLEEEEEEDSIGEAETLPRPEPMQEDEPVSYFRPWEDVEREDSASIEDEEDADTLPRVPPIKDEVEDDDDTLPLLAGMGDEEEEEDDDDEEWLRLRDELAIIMAAFRQSDVEADVEEDMDEEEEEDVSPDTVHPCMACGSLHRAYQPPGDQREEEWHQPMRFCTSCGGYHPPQQEGVFESWERDALHLVNTHPEMLVQESQMAAYWNGASPPDLDTLAHIKAVEADPELYMYIMEWLREFEQGEE